MFPVFGIVYIGEFEASARFVLAVDHTCCSQLGFDTASVESHRKKPYIEFLPKTPLSVCRYLDQWGSQLTIFFFSAHLLVVCLND